MRRRGGRATEAPFSPKREGSAGHAQAQQRLEQLGWKLDENFIAAVFYGTGHAEKFWSRRIELPINWWLSKIS